MRIDKYFDIIKSLLSKLSYTKESRLFFEEDPSGEIGKIRGIIHFKDGTYLRVFEEIRVGEKEFITSHYAYHYGRKGKLLFRYDSKPEKRYRRLKTYPHHLHTKEGKVTESDIPKINLQKVLKKLISESY